MQGSKGARKRGQLSSLLVEAYQNREVLEEKIAEGRRNRKEAGNKYGAFRSIRVGGVCRLTFRKDFNCPKGVIVVLLARFPSVWPSVHVFCDHGPCLLLWILVMRLRTAGWLRLYSDGSEAIVFNVAHTHA